MAARGAQNEVCEDILRKTCGEECGRERCWRCVLHARPRTPLRGPWSPTREQCPSLCIPLMFDLNLKGIFLKEDS